MFIECDRGTAARQKLRETLLAIDQFVIPQIIALQFDQIKGDQRHVVITENALGALRVVEGTKALANNSESIDASH